MDYGKKDLMKQALDVIQFCLSSNVLIEIIALHTIEIEYHVIEKGYVVDLYIIETEHMSFKKVV